MATAQRLDTLHVAGYRSIRDQVVQFGDLNVLVGANGAGKSNLIELFDFLGALVDGELATFVRKLGGASQVLHGGPETTEQITIELEFGDNAYEATFGYGVNDELVFEHEAAYFHDREKYPDRPYGEPLGSGGLESHLPDAAREKKRVYDWVFTSLRAYRVYHFHDTSRTAAVKRKGPLGDNLVLRSDAANLAAYLFRLRETRRPAYDRIVAAIQTVTPFFRDFDLKPDAIDEDRIQLEWRQRGSSHYLNANALSDGTLRFICLATLLLSDAGPRLIVLDEPELGLHPFAIRQLAAMLRSASAQRQVIVATQAVPLVDQFEIEDIVAVDREAGESVFKRLDPATLEGWMDEYSLGELWDKNLLGGRPRHEQAL